MRHSALPVDVENVVMALPNGAHPMGTVLTAINALSTCHPEQNPAVAGQHIYKSTAVQDKQIVRLIGKAPTMAAYAYHKLSGRMPSPPNQKLGYAENFLYMLDAGSAPDYKPNPRLARALEVCVVWCIAMVLWYSNFVVVQRWVWYSGGCGMRMCVLPSTTPCQSQHPAILMPRLCLSCMLSTK